MNEIGLISDDRAFDVFAKDPVQSGALVGSKIGDNFAGAIFILRAAHVGGDAGIAIHRPIL